MNLLRSEMRRALHRRAIRVLIALGLLGCVIAGSIAFFTSQSMTLAELRSEDGHPALLVEWWNPERNDGMLAVAMFFLVLGGLFGGATVAGAEWRAGTITTVLTWEPRRGRLHAARCASSAILAFVISAAVQILFLLSFVPAVVANGSTAGADRAFWLELVATVVRTSALTAAAALLAVSLATAARNTAFAVIAVFAWLVVVENLVRGLKPSLAEWLWGENLGTVMTWAQLEDADFTRGPWLALTTLAFYCAIVVVLGTMSFTRRDIGSAG
jgi:ABC-type transport system involved in multi-copper enzyme maturation permease subunit